MSGLYANLCKIMEQLDINTFDFTRFNHQIEKTQTAGKLLNYYGDLIQRIEYAINSESIIKEIPKRVSDVPVFNLLISNKTYTNIFNIKLNSIHKLAEDFEKGIVYLEKLTLSNTSKWLRKHFKNEIKLFESTQKEIAIKSYFDLKDKNCPIKYTITFDFHGVNPNNQGKFNEINQLSKELIGESDLMSILQSFINVTTASDIQIISKSQLLDLIENDAAKPTLSNSGEIITFPIHTDNNVLSIAKHLVPALNIKMTLIKGKSEPELRYHIGNNRGSFSEVGIKNHIISLIIELLFKLFKTHGVTDVRAAMYTHSIYFNFNEKNIRISDHVKPFAGITCLVKWNTDFDAAVKEVNKLFF